jgi:hypothetical protein
MTYTLPSLLGSIARKTAILYNSQFMTKDDAYGLMNGICALAHSMEVDSEMDVHHLNALHVYTIKLIQPTKKEGLSTLNDLAEHLRLAIFKILDLSPIMQRIISEVKQGRAALEVCDNSKLMEVHDLITKYNTGFVFSTSNIIEDYLEQFDEVENKSLVERDEEYSIDSYYE